MDKQSDTHSLEEFPIGFSDPKELSDGELMVVGVDGSKSADLALSWYKENLHKEGNRLCLVLAIEWPSIPSRDAWDNQVEKSKKKKAELQKKYDDMLKEWKISGSFICELGKPGEVVVAVAKAKKARYIVVGSRGLGAVKRMILGSVSDYILHHSPIPVAVVNQAS